MDIGIEKKSITKITKELNVALANQHVLYQKLRNFHWNVRGVHFKALHELFEEQYTELFKDIDEVAERIRSLDENTIGTYTEYLKIAEIKETPGKYPDETKMIKELLEDNETIIKGLRKASEICSKEEDSGTEDLLIGLLQKHEKQAWMLRSMLK